VSGQSDLPDRANGLTRPLNISEQQHAAAARCIRRRARDPEDAEVLLAALGLDEEATSAA
jgi:hypothetical protein